MNNNSNVLLKSKTLPDPPCGQVINRKTGIVLGDYFEIIQSDIRTISSWFGGAQLKLLLLLSLALILAFNTLPVNAKHKNVPPPPPRNSSRRT